MKKKPKNRIRSSILIFSTIITIFTLSTRQIFAEVNYGMLKQTIITGTVIDSKTNDPLPGVSIVVKGTSRGVVTDLSGKYSIEANQGDVLIFSFIGYQSNEKTIGTETKIDIMLIPDIIDLSEVVVVGYGTMKKSDVTGSISSVSSEQIKAMPVSSLDQALQGKAAGVIVQSSSGSPAGGVSVLVRGASSINASSQPLYVIDGVPISNTSTSGIANIDGGQGGQTSNPLAAISPDDIEKIDILKDASAAAIYGTRGANGVILITTKRGMNSKNNFSFNAYSGFQSLPKKLDVLNATDFVKYRLIGHMNSINESTYPVFTEQLDPINDDGIPYTTLHPDSFDINTNWQEEAYQLAPIQNYHLTASGGSKTATYSVSGGYYSVDGILIGSSFDRLSLKANTDIKLREWLDFGNSMLVSYSKENMSFNDAYYNGGMVERILQMQPLMQVKDEDGNFVGPSEEMDGLPDNPIAAELEKQDDNVVSRLVGNIYAQLNLAKGLNFRSSFGADMSNARTTLFSPSVDRGAIYIERARMRESIQQNMYWNLENYFTYSKNVLNDHNFNVVAGNTRSFVKWDQFSAYRDGFPSNESRNLNLGELENMSNSAYAGHQTLIGYYGRLVYSLSEYLTLTTTHRWDADSRFGKDYKWGYFPSYALAWKITSHDFMNNLNFINFMKLRLGYGLTGNSNLSGIPYIARLRPVEVTMNNAVIPAFEPDGKDNPDVHWETVKTYNLGLDVNFLENRFQLVVDAYNKISDEMLIIQPLTVTVSPFGSPWANAAKMENKGIEVSLISNNISGTFSWSSQVTYSYNRNKILELQGTSVQQTITTRDPFLTNTVEGYPIAQFYGHVTDGIFKTQQEVDEHAYQSPRTSVGDIRFKDLNGDGTITDDDKTFIGNPIPMHVYGITNTFSYKGFDMNIFLQGTHGNKVFNWTRRTMEALAGQQNQLAVVLDTYVPEDIYLRTDHGDFLVAEANTDTDMPRITTTDNNNNKRLSDRYVEDASYLKIQSITFGYTFPENLAQKVKAERLRVYASGKNLFTFTKYSGYEPEHGALNNNSLLTGIDIGNYPVPRSIIIGVNLDF
ncbi:MAG: TonB-dependent receptor [Bacteroidales bacterium]|nr:TonB-dependent receptor [Bacteroidales bacterium]MBN2818572.1 TonB-dependent receptor [Bacteroidales bacterium]